MRRVKCSASMLGLAVLACSGPEGSSGLQDIVIGDVALDASPGDREGESVLDQEGDDALVVADPLGEVGPLRRCTLPGDCPTGVCVEAADGATYCAESCLDEPCPLDWKCTQVLIAGDPNWLCLPRATYLCRPCRVHEDCAPKGLWSKAYCIEHGGTWFCGQDCSSGLTCPPGYECREVEVEGTGLAMQCLPEGGECACIEEFVKGGYEAACVIKNEWGTCRGSRRCGPEGLGPCGANIPGPEVCDGLDDDCDDRTDPEGSQGCLWYYQDADRDLFGPQARGSRCLCAPEGLWSALKAGDCDDSDPDRNPGVPEKCGDGRDNDCDGQTDEEGAIGCLTFFADRDSDGHGVLDDARCLCGPDAPYTASVAGDCDDGDGASYPGGGETCGGADEDCDGQTDEEGAIGCEVLFWDGDGDGVGVIGDSRCLCAPLERYTAEVSGDCNDSSAAVLPGARERCNGLDDDCDAATDEDFALKGQACDGPDEDLCMEGVFVCNALESGLNCTDETPTNVEICNGLDDDCNGLTDEKGASGCMDFYYDKDRDGWGGDSSQCLCQETGAYTATRPGDCNDDDANIHPGAPERCNGVNDDCDGATDEDFALKGQACDGPDDDLCKEGVFVCNALETGLDCTDDTATNVERCNGQDDDCDGATDEDFALKGQACDGPDDDLCKEGVFVCNALETGLQCTDETPTNVEKCNSLDDDCDGATDQDFALKGQACDGPDDDLCKEGVFVCDAQGTGVECNDFTDTSIERCNGLDDDCDGVTDEGEDLVGCRTFYLDADGDGWGLAVSKCLCGASGIYRASKMGDCRDDLVAVFPGAPEVCDGLDNDCNGFTDEGHDAYPNFWPGPFGPDPFNPWRYPQVSFASTYEVLTPSGDVDFFSVEATEAKLSQCLSIQCKVTLSAIPEGQDYVLCACWSDIAECDMSGGQWTCSDNPGNATETVTVVLLENPPPPASCQVSGVDLQNHGYCDIRVSRVSGPASCTPYQLNWIVWE